MEQRLIDANALMDALNVFKDRKNGNEHFMYGIETAKELLGIQPTVDAVQVMRCKDCKMWGCPIPIEYTMKEEGYEYCGALWTNTHKDDFCAWGERRSDGA